MNLKDILERSESKLRDEKYVIRKAAIARTDRPYKDDILDFNRRQKDDNKVTSDFPSVMNCMQKKEPKSNLSNGRQKGDKRKTISRQKDCRGYERQKDDDRTTNGRQTVQFDKHQINTWNIHGNEKKLYSWIKYKCGSDGLISFPVTKDEIISETGIASTCIKKTLDRLIEKQLIVIYASQNGRFGWRIFKLKH